MNGSNRQECALLIGAILVAEFAHENIRAARAWSLNSIFITG
jgi:hypothetical protein